MYKRHISILVQEILEFLPQHDATIVDGTFGHGGHSLAFSDYAKVNNYHYTIRGFDRDSQVLSHGKTYIEQHQGSHD